MKAAAIFSLSVLIAVTASAFAQTGGMQGMDTKGMDMKGMDKKAQDKPHKGVGVVKSVDPKKGTVTISHEPIQSMKWPAMSMTFTAKDKKMLEDVKPGAKVEFEFVQQGSKHNITSIK